ncbi:MAG: IclR family transcriptional regulator, partial [Pseudonocardiaceae bacterium]|nr:IclR family transcriptional regulator [Pseudonocardiaceae bacterium]
LLCDWEPDVIRRWFDDTDLSTSGERPRVRTVDELVNELALVRRRGYALVREEFEVGVVGCSAPVRDVRGRIIAAMNVSAPSPRLGDRLDQAGQLTARCASDISRALQQEDTKR